MAALADAALHAFQSRVLHPAASLVLDPVCRLAEHALVSVLAAGITDGQLTIHTPATTYTFPAAPTVTRPGPVAALTVVRPTFWLRLALMGDLGFAEAYMYGDVRCDSLTALFELLLTNRACLARFDTLLARLGRIPARLAAPRLLDALTRAQRNISAHYDISNAMFEAFLSRDMTYSCALWPELDADLGEEARAEAARTAKPLPPQAKESEEDRALYDAQIRKLRWIVKRADIRPGHRVLEIGTGWGSLALLIARSVPGTTVDTLTLSYEQAGLAAGRVVAAGFGGRVCVACGGGGGARGSVAMRRRGQERGRGKGGAAARGETGARAGAPQACACACAEPRIRVHLMDYRSMPAEWEGAFDRVVSVEMVEAVGREWLETYWGRIEWALKKDTGVGVVQGITIPEARFDAYVRDTDFIRKWVLFPGGFLPTLTLLLSTLERGAGGRLVVESVQNIGPHYARTLREWRARFEGRFDGEIVAALKKQHPDVMGDSAENGTEEIEVFRRKWVYYFCYCEAGFASRSLGDHIITFTREGNVGYGCQVPE